MLVLCPCMAPKRAAKYLHWKQSGPCLTEHLFKLDGNKIQYNFFCSLKSKQNLWQEVVLPHEVQPLTHSPVIDMIPSDAFWIFRSMWHINQGSLVRAPQTSSHLFSGGSKMKLQSPWRFKRKATALLLQVSEAISVHTLYTTTTASLTGIAITAVMIGVDLPFFKTNTWRGKMK